MRCKGLLLSAVSLLVLFSCSPRDRYITFSGYAQGGTYTVKLNLNGRDGMIRVRPEVIRDSVDAILRDIDNSLSGYNRKSLLSRFNSGETIVPDSLFLDIYEKSYDFYIGTGGVLDVASAPLFDMWGFGFKSGEMPDREKVDAVLEISGVKRLHRNMREIFRLKGAVNGKDMLVADSDVLPELNYNAVAQGYSCDVVAVYLYSIGVKDMMVDIGEIFCDGVNPSGNQWTIGIDRPVDGNNKLGADVQGIFKVPSGPHGVVTSGNYRKFYVKDGKKYAHTIDPRTGYPVDHNLLTATIVAPDAVTADAYATYCMAIGLEASQAFLESRDDMEGCLIYDEDGEFRVWCTPEMRRRLSM